MQPVPLQKSMMRKGLGYGLKLPLLWYECNWSSTSFAVCNVYVSVSGLAIEGLSDRVSYIESNWMTIRTDGVSKPGNEDSFSAKYAQVSKRLIPKNILQWTTFTPLQTEGSKCASLYSTVWTIRDYFLTEPSKLILGRLKGATLSQQDC